MDPKVWVDPLAPLDKMEPQAPSDPKDHVERLYVPQCAIQCNHYLML